MPAYIAAIGTAVPRHKLSQNRIGEFMALHLAKSEEEQKTLALLYRASGIRSRYSVIPDFGLPMDSYSFFPKNKDLTPFPSVKDRMLLYEREALPLAQAAIRDCMAQLSPEASQITHLITVSCTGMYAPGLDIQLVERLGLPTNTERTCINFMGCYASFNALKAANQILKNEPKSQVLIVALELCSIHLQHDTGMESLLSAALFGDGAAAVLVTGKALKEKLSLELTAFHSDLALEAKSEMSWRIGEHGFEMVLSQEVPEAIRKGIGKLTARLMAKVREKTPTVAHYAIHPGGRKILEVIEQTLGLSKEVNEPAYEVLRQYGNMSSPTVLFVLKSILEKLTQEDVDQHVLSFAFGPGLTLESMLLKVHGHA